MPKTERKTNAAWDKERMIAATDNLALIASAPHAASDGQHQPMERNNILTAKQAAELTFTAWEEDVEFTKLISNPDWDEFCRNLGFTVRCSYAGNLLTKEKMLKGVREEPEAFLDLMEDIGRKRKFLNALSSVLETAEIRLISCLSQAEIDGGL